MNFLLLRAGNIKENKESIFFSAASHPPLGLLYIATPLLEKKHHVKIIDYFIDKNAEKNMIRYLKKADMVGISVYTINYKDAIEISKKIKKLKPHIPIVIGGPHCIYLKEQSLLDIPYADISVVGEGERVILDIADYLEGKKDLSEIPGIFYKEENNIKQGRSIEIIKNLDEIKHPARHLIDRYDYGDVSGVNIFKKKVTAMITSRGCPFKCRFCTRYSNVIKGWSYRTRSAEDVIEEFKILKGKYKSVMIVDDNFLADTKRAHKIFDKMLELDLIFDIYIEGARVETADLLLYKKMKKAGVKSISYGIESGNQDVLDFYNKKITLDQIRKAVRLARKARLRTYATFIFGAPIETKNHLENTIDFACSLPLDIAVFGILGYTIGSQLWHEAVREKKIQKNEYRVLADSNRDLGILSIDEIKEYIEKAFQRFYHRPYYVFSQLYFALIKGEIHLLINYSKIFNEVQSFSKDIK